MTGTSGQQGVVTFTVEVTDSDSPPQESTRLLSVTTVDTGLALRLMTRALPDGRVGTAYSYKLRFGGGTGPSSWAIRAGSALPPGLRFDAPEGALQGVPSQSGTYTVHVTVSDLLQSVERTLTLEVGE